MGQDRTIKVLLIVVIILGVLLGLRMTVFKDFKFGENTDLSSEAVVNAISNQTSAYVNSTIKEKNRYNEMEQSMDAYSNK